MKTLSLNRREPLRTSVKISSGFWGDRCAMNRENAIFYQWEQLQKTGRVDNLRIIAGIHRGVRKGFFYNDSDVHKWAEAASAIVAAAPGGALSKILDEYIGIVRQAQTDDGYVFTYNQFHFPSDRWKNLQIEHELYTHGHLIEAGVTHFESTGRTDFLELARKAADLVAGDFSDAGPAGTPGHEEIEIALIRLYRVTNEKKYLEAARHFLEQRGRIPLFGFHLIRQFVSQSRRAGSIRKQERLSAGGETSSAGFDVTENLTAEEPPFIKVRANISFLSGRFFQQHRPIRKLRSPEGHAVRWGYLAAAMAMLYRETGDQSLLHPLIESWDRMVRRRMYVTGGIGSLPIIEGFGRDYELHNRYAYCETCAALASIFWSNEMHLATGEAPYADLIEWQLYNASSAGIALDGRSYLYRNPLESESQIRRPWYATACCPSNISRTWASLGRYIYSLESDSIYVNQYISNVATLGHGDGLHHQARITMESAFPWDGDITLTLQVGTPVDLTLYLRVPSWTKNPAIAVNGIMEKIELPVTEKIMTAGGYSPFRSCYVPLRRRWEGEATINATFPMEVTFHRSHPRVRLNRRSVALSRGPLVYCIESIDNVNTAVPGAVLDAGMPIQVRNSDSPLTGIRLLTGADPEGGTLTFIPYFCWANRGPSSMQVWVREDHSHDR